MAAYIDWAKESLGLSLAYEIALEDLGDGERGVVSGPVEIPANVVVARIPFSSLMTVKTLEGSPLEVITAGLREEDSLALLLLYEKFISGSESKWSHHIDHLPVQYHSIVNYNEEELRWIIGSNLYVIATQWKRQIKNDFNELVAHLNVCSSDARTATAATTLLQSDKLNEQNYTWALCTIWSRFISVSRRGATFKAMVPVVDMLNHNVESKMSHVYNDEADEFQLVTAQPWSAGSQMYLNYGLVPNSKLLMLYGFALFKNPHASVDVWAAMDPNSPQFKLKVSILSKVGINCQEEPFVLIGDTLPVKLFAFLRVQHADSKTILRWATVASTAVLQPQSKATETAVCAALRSAVEGILAGYQQHSVVDDEVRLRAWGYDTTTSSLAASTTSATSTPTTVVTASDASCPNASTSASTSAVDSESSEPSTVSTSPDDSRSVFSFLHPSQREINAVIMRHSEMLVLTSVLSCLDEYVRNVVSQLP